MVSKNVEHRPDDSKEPSLPPDTDASLPPPSSTSRSWSNDPLIGRRLGEYQIRRVLGRGGMGSVYEALHIHLHKPVAIKVLASHLLDDPRAVERFKREMRAIGRVNSPHIVQALDASLTGEIHYLVMEYIDGLDADELVRRLHGIPVEDACDIIRQAALGLADAHTHQLVHRDIKPKNLAVSMQGRVKLLDFGLALCKTEVLATGRLTHQAAIGSYQYMAPEQFDDSHDVDIRADLYSLGCSFYHLLVGHPPFSGDKYRTLVSLMDAHRLHPPPAVIESNGLVGPELSAIIDRLLAKKPQDRIQSPEELAQLLGPHAQRSNLPAIVSMACASAPDPASITQLPDRTGADRSTPDLANIEATRVHRSGVRQRIDHGAEKETPRRNPIPWLIGLAATLLVVIVGLLFYGGYRAHEKAQHRANANQRREIARYIETLPGLNGNWWLDETPWLLPSVRSGLFHAMEEDGVPPLITLDEAEIDSIRDLRKQSNTDLIQDQIREITNRIIVHHSSSRRSSFFSIEGDDPETLDESKLRSKFENIDQWHQTNGQTISPIDLHVQAVARHKQGRFSEAEELYRKSLAGLEAGSTQSTAVTPIEASGHISLVWADYGELLYTMGRYDDAALQFRLASESVTGPIEQFAEFIIYTRCRESDSLRKSIDGRSQAKQALQTAEPAVAKLPTDHPLVAFFHERQGWLALDEWQASNAAKSFRSAIALRQKNIDAGNRRAPFFLYFDEQGLAMAERLQGLLNDSRQRLEQLANRVEKARTEPKRLSAKQRSELESRYLNALERLADVPLFDLGQPDQAREPLERAIDFARRESLNEGRLARHIDRIRFKLAIAHAATGREREATQTMAEASSTTLLGIDQQYRELAKGAIALAKNDFKGGESIAKIILSIDPDRASRDDLELGFLAARLFYRAPDMPAELVEKVIRRHTRWAESIGRLAEDRSLLEYLRPHYDSIMEAAVSLTDFPPAEIAHIALEATTPRSSTVEKDSLIFYFEKDHGWAMDIDAQGSAVVVPLSIGSDAIATARDNDQEKSELAQRIPEPIRQRAKSLPPEKIRIADPVLDLTTSDAEFLTH